MDPQMTSTEPWVCFIGFLGALQPLPLPASQVQEQWARFSKQTGRCILHLPVKFT